MTENFDLNALLNQPATNDGTFVDVSDEYDPPPRFQLPKKVKPLPPIRIVPPVDDVVPFSLDEPKKQIQLKVGKPKKMSVAQAVAVDTPKRSNSILSVEDTRFIDDSAGRLKVEEIAQEIGKTHRVVYNYMQKHNLLSEDDTQDARLKNMIINRLRNQSWWIAIEQSYTEIEQKRFEEEWYAHYMQLDQNIQPSEEIQLKQAITLSIQLDRLDAAEHKANIDALEFGQQVDELKDEVAELKVERSQAQDREEKDFIKEQINLKNMEIQAAVQFQTAARQSLSTFGKERKDILQMHGKLLSDLKATRDKRVDSYAVSDKTWAHMLTELRENPRLKKQMGCIAYLSWISVERMKVLLQKDYTFVSSSGHIDTHPLMLLPEKVENEEMADMIEQLYVPKVQEEKFVVARQTK